MGVLEEVALPVTGYSAGLHLDGTRGDWRHMGNLASSISAACPRATRLTCLPQRGQQFAAQRAVRQDVQTDIDGLSREEDGENLLDFPMTPHFW